MAPVTDLPRKEQLALVVSLLPQMPSGRRLWAPLVEIQKYRGKRQYVVGYTWSKPYSHHMSGLVYDCVLGWGETFDAAVERMKKKSPK